jgi:hypothetical protein
VAGDTVGSQFNPTKRWLYVVTAISATTGGESYASLPYSPIINLSSISPATVTIPNAVQGASGYNVYRGRNAGVYGLVGTTADLTFYDDGIEPDYTTAPLIDPVYLNAPTTATPTIASLSSPCQSVFGTVPSFRPLYCVSAVGAGGESFASDIRPIYLVGDVSAACPVTLTWGAIAGATGYRIFRTSSIPAEAVEGFGLVGASSGLSFIDSGAAPNFSQFPVITYQQQPPGAPPITFDAPGKYPSCAAFLDQRLILAGTDDAPDTVFGSRAGDYRNFAASSPAGDGDAFEFTLAALTVDRIKGLIHSRVLNVFTGSSEYVVQGSKGGAIGPSSIDAKAHAHYGSGELAPLAVGGRVLFNQEEGQSVREFRYDFQLDGYTGEDERSVLAKHLLEGHSIVDWAYAKGPDSVVWMVRDDGVLLGMSYLPAHDVIAWHRHETDGLVESVACIPEVGETGVYVSVFREVAGGFKRFVERFASRQITDVKDAVFLDCSLTYRSPDFTGRPLFFAENLWLADTQAYCGLNPVNAPYFVAAHVGSQVVFNDADGNEYRATILTIINGTTVGVLLQRDIPVALRAALTETTGTGTAWTHALKVFSFPHLGVGKTVSALVDGSVVDGLVVDSSGNVTLPEAGSTVTIGLPYTSELETLDINVDGRSLQTVKKVVGKVWFEVRSSRGLFAGESGARMAEWKQKQVVDGTPNAGAAMPLATMRDSVTISGGWGYNGRVLLRQRDPLPCEVLSITPEVTFGA